MMTVLELVRDEGTIVLFRARYDEGQLEGEERSVAVDHRMAQLIADALKRGQEVVIDPEDWQVLG